MTQTVDTSTNEYLPLETVKKFLNIEEAFEDDDLLIMGFIDAALAATERYLDRPLSEYVHEGQLPSGLKTCAMFLIGTWYAQRESVSTASYSEVPHTFELLCDLYRNYDYNKAINADTLKI